MLRFAFLAIAIIIIAGCDRTYSRVADTARHYKPAPDPWWPVEPLPIDSNNPWLNP